VALAVRSVARKGQLTFLHEDMKDTRPNFSSRMKRCALEDQSWVPKHNRKLRTRLVWAVRYFADENYYLPHVKVKTSDGFVAARNLSRPMVRSTARASNATSGRISSAVRGRGFTIHSMAQRS
jgi:hypothetical protein